MKTKQRVAKTLFLVVIGVLVSGLPILEGLAKSGVSTSSYQRFLRPPYAQTEYSLGIALSGGGSRSASYSLGVLNEFHRAGILQHVDILSTVSGGGYAAYWYVTNKARGNADADIFRDCDPLWWDKDEDYQKIFAASKEPACKDKGGANWSGADDAYRFQYYLLQNAAIFRKDSYRVTGDAPVPNTPEFTALVRSSVLRKPELTRAYEDGIFRAFGSAPAPRSSARAEFDVSQGSQSIDRTLTWNDLASRLHSGPEWVTSVTAQRSWFRSPSPNNSFEIGTRGFGNGDFGYRSGPYEGLNVLQSVRTSAAFVDMNAPVDSIPGGPLGKVLLALTKLPMGETVENPFRKSGTLRLSDGGQAENLGLLPLIRRHVRQIVVVDGGYDRAGVFDDLCKVRKSVSSYASINLNDIDLDGLCSSSKKATNLSDQPYRAMLGSIQYSDGSAPSELFYLKLGWNEQLLKEMTDKLTGMANAPANTPQCGTAGSPSCLLVGHYWHNAPVYNPRDRYMYFPQYATVGSTLRMSGQMYWGLRELGRYHASALNLSDGKLSIGDERVGVPLYQRRRGIGPINNPNCRYCGEK